jgi:cyclopropane fatty-acyl-phospholipid synthase-like methyltransferase
MKPANDPTIDYKALVRTGYDRCADRYNEARASEPPSGLALLARHLSPGSRVLDIGCGAGVPVTSSLAGRFRVTGVDFSNEQIRRARLNVPQAEFIESDIMAVKFSAESFDAVVAFFVLFHLPCDEQRELLHRVHDWLVPDGLLLATLSVFNEPPYTENDFFGVPMYWTNFAHEEYHDLVCNLGFEVLSDTAVGHGFSESYAGAAERHPLVLARKVGGLSVA